MVPLHSLHLKERLLNAQKAWTVLFGSHGFCLSFWILTTTRPCGLLSAFAILDAEVNQGALLEICLELYNYWFLILLPHTRLEWFSLNTVFVWSGTWKHLLTRAECISPCSAWLWEIVSQLISFRYVVRKDLLTCSFLEAEFQYDLLFNLVILSTE